MNHALALNNIAISLLQSQCYDQAWETLHDAAQLAGNAPSCLKFDADCCLQDAVARQCRPEPSTSKCSLTLQVLPHYADSAACLHATSSGVAAIMIRLDTFEFATNDDDEICDVNRTFVLHNYAIASLVVALANPGAITSASLLQNCLKLLLRCQQILARISGKAMLSSWDLMHKVYSLALISTSNMLLVLTRLGAGQFQLEAEELETKLESLRQILAKLDPPSVSHILAAASA